jgi:hypothetical protein
MSKSIYGVRLPGTMGDVFNQLHGLRPLVSRKAGRLLSHAVARIATDHHDRAVIFGSEDNNHLSRAFVEVQERIAAISQTNIRDPEVDTSFDVVICDDGDHAVLMSFTEHDDWFSDLLSLPGANDFSFWDGADRPEDVTEKEWTLRRRTYDRILSRDPHGRPGGCGVSLVFQPPASSPDPEQVLSQVPDIDSRATRIARQVLVSEWSLERGVEDIDMAEFMSFASKLNTPEMQDEISAKARDIKQMLPEIDLNALRGIIPEVGYEETPSL